VDILLDEQQELQEQTQRYNIIVDEYCEQTTDLSGSEVNYE
jgi:hypothetical protein